MVIVPSRNHRRLRSLLRPGPGSSSFVAQAGLLQARWSGEIHGEWMRNLLKNNPRLDRERLERTRSLMDAAVRDCLVTGYTPLIAYRLTMVLVSRK